MYAMTVLTFLVGENVLSNHSEHNIKCTTVTFYVAQTKESVRKDIS